MKTAMVLLIVAAFALGGCDDDDDVTILRESPAPQPPQGVTSVTGDDAVYLFWFGPYDHDLDEFIVYRSDVADAGYNEIGRVDAEDNPNLNLIIYKYIDLTAANGDSWYYAVATVDLDGRVSELSAEDVFDTPRPEGEVQLADTTASPADAGYNFVFDTIVSFDSPFADIWIDQVGGTFYINSGLSRDSWLQDMGYTDVFTDTIVYPDTLRDVGEAPVDGWTAFTGIELIEGHTYVIWTDDQHFAKMRVKELYANSVLFQWAYQLVRGLPELAPPSDGGDGSVVIDNSSSNNAAVGQ